MSKDAEGLELHRNLLPCSGFVAVTKARVVRDPALTRPVRWTRAQRLSSIEDSRFPWKSQTYVWYVGVRSGTKGDRPEQARCRGTPTMVEKVQEPIEVLSRFVEGKIQPVRFRWRGRVYTVSRISSAWRRRDGEQPEHFFSVGTGAREHYELCYRPQTSQWTLENVYREGAG